MTYGIANDPTGNTMGNTTRDTGGGPAPADPVIETHDITKRYGARAAVDRVSLTIRRGEVYGFLGPNGAGKTTTLRMLLGLIRPTSGTASVLGAAPGTPAAARQIGALVEGPGFYPYLSGRDNLRVLARYQRLPDSEVDAVLERVDLATRAGDRFRSYSLGMKQRLGVAAALLGSPQVLILDEPTNGLDPAGMADMRLLVVELAAHGQTVVLSSHLLAEVQEICDRVGVIDRGRLLAESTVADLRGASALLVRAEPVDRALAVALEIAGDDNVELEPGGHVVRVADGDGRASELVRALIAADVSVHEVTHSERSLEDVFFELTADGHTRADESATDDLMEVSR